VPTATQEEIPSVAQVQNMLTSKRLALRMFSELLDDEKFSLQAKRLMAEVERTNKAYDDLKASRRNATMLMSRTEKEILDLEKLLQKSERKTEYLRMIKLREKLAAMEAAEAN